MRLASIFAGAALIGTALLIALGTEPRALRAQENVDSWRLSGVIERGREIAPVSLNLEGKNPQLVYLGSYVVNSQGGCNSCHTCPSFRPGAGKSSGTVNGLNYLAGGVPFGGVPSPNLTPDGAGLPGGLTYDQFAAVMQDGQHHVDSGHVLQTTAWPDFANMFPGDLAAVYEYLRALPGSKAGACSRASERGLN